MREKLDSIWKAPAQRRIYRRLLDAMARPGTVADIADALDGRKAIHGILATLVDGEVKLADPDGLVAESDWPLIEARRSNVAEAHFVAINGSRYPSEPFEPNIGTLSNPEYGATLILQVAALDKGATRAVLSGPGIKGTYELAAEGLDVEWLRQRNCWVAEFPMGVDLILCDAVHVAAVPRSTHMTLSGE